MIRFVYIRQHERGLWFRRGDFIELLGPGGTWLFRPRDRVEIVDTLKARFEHPLLDVITERPELRRQLEVIDLADMQRAIVWKDGRLLHILGPGRHAFWKTNARLEIETYSIAPSESA